MSSSLQAPVQQSVIQVYLSAPKGMQKDVDLFKQVKLTFILAYNYTFLLEENVNLVVQLHGEVFGIFLFCSCMFPS